MLEQDSASPMNRGRILTYIIAARTATDPPRLICINPRRLQKNIIVVTPD